MDYSDHKATAKKADKKNNSYMQQELIRYWNAGIHETEFPSPQAVSVPRYKSNLYLDLFDPLFGLNKDQISLLQARENIIAVNSPPGTGKSAMLTTLAAYWIKQKKYQPGEILILSLAETEISSLQQNLSAMLGEQSREVHIATFQQIAFSLLGQANRGMLKLYNRNERLNFMALIFPFLGNKEIRDLSLYIEQYGHNSGFLAQEESRAMAESYLSSLSKIGAADLETLIAQTYDQLISNPGLLVKFKARYKAILLDDFQDMDPAKFKLFSLLINNELSHTEGAGGERKVIVFNDHNQSRVGMPATENPLYHTFLAEFAEHELGFHKNYRSQHCIIKAAKTLIKKYSHKRNLKYTSTRERGEGCKYFAATSGAEEVAFIVRRISGILEEQASDITPGEIGILYRQRGTILELAAGLREAGLPCYLPPGLPLIQTSPFKLIFALFHFMLNRKDITSLADLLLNLYPGFNRGDIQSIFLAGNRKEETLEMLINRIYQEHQLTDKQYTHLTDLLKFMRKLKNQVLNTGIGSALEMITARYPRLNPLKTGNETEYTLLKQRAEIYELDLRGFLNSFYLEADNMAETLHKQYINFVPCDKIKGREFKVLFIPCLEEGTFPMLTRDIEREYRLFYQALTRAKEQIFFSSAALRQGKKTVASSFLHDLGNQIETINMSEKEETSDFTQQELLLL